MIRFLLGTLFVLAILDLILLFWIGMTYGFLSMLAVVLLPGLLGGGVAKQQGAHTLGRIEALLREGRAPSTELVEGGAILVAGLLLLYPGPLSTLLGVILLIPWPRRLVARAALALRQRIVSRSGVRFEGHVGFGNTGLNGRLDGAEPNRSARPGPGGLKAVEGEVLSVIKEPGESGPPTPPRRMGWVEHADRERDAETPPSRQEDDAGGEDAKRGTAAEHGDRNQLSTYDSKSPFEESTD